jgi:signal transduction histidine kinase
MDRFEKAGIALLVLLLAAVPTAVHGWPETVAGNVFTASILASGLTLAWWWRTRPRLVAVLGGALWLTAALLGRDGWFPEPVLALMAALAAAAALAWTGRAAWLAALGVGVYLYIVWLAVMPSSPVAVVMFSVPGFLAGTVLRLRREAVDELARRGRELEEERELFAEISLRHERARIASELHDIVGHAISVMVIQAAAGQRLVDHDPDGARQAFTAIAESARQGREDLHRLVELLGGRDVGVRVLVNGSGRGLTIRVENDRSVQERPNLSGTGRGLAGLRERIHELGGQLRAGPTRHGGWLVEAVLPG